MSDPYQPCGSNNPFAPPTPLSSSNSSFGGFPPGGSPGSPSQPPPTPGTSMLAMFSLIAGIGSFLAALPACCCLASPLIVISSLASVVMGHLALAQINRSQGATSGKEFAWFGLLAGYPSLLFSLVMSGVWLAAMFAPQPPPGAAPVTGGPGAAELAEVESKIAANERGAAQGNSPEAILLAQKFSATMKTLREAFFTAEKRKGISLSDGEFVTWCELHDGKCAFIVHVPSYRKFNDDAKEGLENLCWLAAQQSVRGTLQDGDELAVGMKGVLLWGSVKVGRVVPEESEDNGVIAAGKDETLLHPFFASEADPTEVPQIKLPDEPAPGPASEKPIEPPANEAPGSSD